MIAASEGKAVTVTINHDTATTLLRAMMRAQEHTPGRELVGFEATISLVNDWWARTLDPGLLNAVGRAMDRQSGR